jgi:fimbrial chaperone protein
MTIRRLIGLTNGGGRVRTATFAMGLAALAAIPSAQASTFQVNPVVLEVVAGRQNAVLTVRNSEAVPVSIQLHLFRWTQKAGEDVYAETDDLIASPPIVTIPAAGTQIVRIGPRAGQLSGAYRVMLEEILPAAVRKGEVRIALRLNLPLYVTPANAAMPALRWSGWRDATGSIVLQADNDGGRYATVVALGAIDAAQKAVPLTSRFGAVLPGGSRRWVVGKHPELGAGTTLQLTVSGSDGTSVRTPVTLVQR